MLRLIFPCLIGRTLLRAQRPHISPPSRSGKVWCSLESLPAVAATSLRSSPTPFGKQIRTTSPSNSLRPMHKLKEQERKQSLTNPSSRFCEGRIKRRRTELHPHFPAKNAVNPANPLTNSS